MRHCVKNSQECLTQGAAQTEDLTVIAVKQRYNATAWKERIAVCRSSKQSVADWCLENGVSNGSYTDVNSGR